MIRLRPALALGLALGAGVTALLPPLSLSHSGDSTAPTPQSLALPTWSGSSPPILDGPLADRLVDAWLRTHLASTRPFAVRLSALRSLLPHLPSTAFPRLLDPLFRTSTPEGLRLADLGFESWIELDPGAATRWAAAHRTARPQTPRALQAWAEIEPSSASAWACGLPEDPVSIALARLALERLARTDADQALAFALGLSPSFQAHVISALLEPLAAADPAGTLRNFGPRIWAKGEGFWALRRPLLSWIRSDPASALDWLLTQPRENAPPLPSLIASLPGDDPAQRLILARALTDLTTAPARQEALGEMLRDWAQEDPTEALAWIRGLADADLRNAVLEHALAFIPQENPEKLLPLALSLPLGAHRIEVIGHTLATWAETDLEAALAWSRAQTDPALLAASAPVQAIQLGRIARDEPDTALDEWGKITDARARSAAILPIAESWAAQDPGAALRWLVAQHYSGTPRYVTTEQEMLHAWSRSAPERALRWAEAQDPALRSEYLDALGGTWNEKAPRAATADLYSKIKDPALRAETLTRHVKEWLTKDPAAARAWLESSSALSPEQAAILLAPAP